MMMLEVQSERFSIPQPKIRIKRDRIEWVVEFGNTSFFHILDISSMEQLIINNIKTKNEAK